MNTLFSCVRSFIVCKSSKRYQSFHFAHLNGRAILRVHGQDTYSFLQGLITNDVNHLDKDGRAMFAHFLNTKGRTLWDALLVKRSDTEVLVDCDHSVATDLTKHLNMYRIRKKVQVELFAGVVSTIFRPTKLLNTSETTVDGEVMRKISEIRNENIAFQDPRVPALGIRIISQELLDKNALCVRLEHEVVSVSCDDYSIHRYKLGVAEGPAELPIGKCFPLETNCDYLHGVSFHKGCYIGQELTARIHHTGVVRKRIMPLILSSVPEIQFTENDVSIGDEKVGIVKGHCQNYAIALLRIAKVSENISNLSVNGVSAFSYIPFWWPQKSVSQRS